MGRRRRRRRRRRPAPPPKPVQVKKAPAPDPKSQGGTTPPQTSQVSSVSKTQASSKVRMDPMNISRGVQRQSIAPTTVRLEGKAMENAIDVFGGIDKEYGAFEKPPLNKVKKLDADVTWGYKDLPAVLIDWGEYVEQDERDRVQYYKILEWVPGGDEDKAPREQTLKPLDFWNKYVETSDERDKDRKRTPSIKTPKFRFSKWNNVVHGGRYGEGRIVRGRGEKTRAYKRRVKIIRAAGKHRKEMEKRGYDYDYKSGTYKKINKSKMGRRYYRAIWGKSSNLKKAIEHKKRNRRRRRRRRRGSWLSKIKRRFRRRR